MSFLYRSIVGSEAEIVAVKVPMYMMKPFLAKELRKDDDEMLCLAMKKIKSVKLTALSNVKDDRRIRENYKNFLSDQDMEEYASIMSDGDRVTISGLMKKDRIKTLMLGVSSEDGDHVFVEVKGDFTLDEIAGAISSYERK